MSLISKIFGKKIEPELLQGFYRDVIPLNDIESSTQSDYEYIAYISEIERYKNNLSKIRLDKIEIVSGKCIDDYPFIKTCVRETFISIVDTNNIQWLEPYTSLKDERKEKLKQIK